MSGSTTPIINPKFSEYEYVDVNQIDESLPENPPPLSQIHEPLPENPSPSSHTIDNDETQEDEFDGEMENVEDTVTEEVECAGAAHYINSVPQGGGEYLQDGQYGDQDSQYGGYEEDNEFMGSSDESQFSSQHTVPSEEGEEYEDGVDSQHYESQNEHGVSQDEDGVLSHHEGLQYENGVLSHRDGSQYDDDIHSQYDEDKIYTQNGDRFYNNVQSINHQGEEDDDVSTIGDEEIQNDEEGEYSTDKDVEMYDANGIENGIDEYPN